MDRKITEQAVFLIPTEMAARLGDGSRIAKAAEACARTGSTSEGVTVSLDIEQPIYEAGRLHNAASLLDRLSRA
ncbi:hypothetical protein [Bradyrhizobium sp. SYSU BS000235]|uniref:hypothetical protein n=1 Tax=Bradyrhizobium sp. SYSU BS000235 TaxID=3411332 RepID=UPI003C728FBE